jgi:POT family proton-dependent oligopeptide transporter
MLSEAVKSLFPELNLRQQQTNNIVYITFWSQFSSHAISAILILFLTRPLIQQGLGYNQAKAYAFMGVAHAMGYLMPVLGGYMADSVVGVRRSIFLGSVMVASAYLLIVLSGYTIGALGDACFLAAYALIPATNSLLMGTASSMISYIHSDDAVKAKSAMTFYYMSINTGGLLAALIAPSLFDSRFGPLSVLALTFAGKSIAALHFARRYSIYDNIVWGQDKKPFSARSKLHLFTYLASIYALTLFAYSHVYLASTLISIGCALGIFWFLLKTLSLTGPARHRQFIALVLILEAVVFFIIYNQLNSTLVLFALNNSDHQFLGWTISPAQYQMLNPLLILIIGSQLPQLYRFFPRFTIPYQFAVGTMLAGLALLFMVMAASFAQNGLVNGNYVALTYVLISFAELFVSAIGLSMIGLYCDVRNIAFAMGIWYLASSMSHTISGRIAAWVAIPDHVSAPVETMSYFQNYYTVLGFVALCLGFLMSIFAFFLHKKMRKLGVDLP